MTMRYKNIGRTIKCYYGQTILPNTICYVPGPIHDNEMIKITDDDCAEVIKAESNKVRHKAENATKVVETAAVTVETKLPDSKTQSENKPKVATKDTSSSAAESKTTPSTAKETKETKVAEADSQVTATDNEKTSSTSSKSTNTKSTTTKSTTTKSTNKIEKENADG